jgi:hypothetical protein
VPFGKHYFRGGAVPVVAPYKMGLCGGLHLGCELTLPELPRAMIASPIARMLHFLIVPAGTARRSSPSEQDAPRFNHRRAPIPLRRLT